MTNDTEIPACNKVVQSAIKVTKMNAEAMDILVRVYVAIGLLLSKDIRALQI